MTSNITGKSRSLFYWHSEGFHEQSLNSTSNKISVTSANLIDFLVLLASKADSAIFSGPIIKNSQRVEIPIANTTAVVDSKLRLSNKFSLLASFIKFILNLIFGQLSKNVRNADISVSVGLDGTGTIVGLVRTLIFSKPHAFVVRGNRLQTITDSSRSHVNKAFAIQRITLYSWIMRWLTNTGKAEIWFQGQAHRENLLDKTPKQSRYRLKILDAVLRDIPVINSAKKTFDLIFTGRLTQEKGLIELLDALKILNEKGLKFKLCIVGAGPDEQLIRDRAQLNGIEEQITWKGFIKDPAVLSRLLGESRVFVLPSYTEGLPRSLLEAMWLGMPCISTPVGGIPFLFKDKETIFFVSTHNSTELSRVVNEVIELDTQGKLRELKKSAKEIAVSCSFDSKSTEFLINACLPSE